MIHHFSFLARCGLLAAVLALGSVFWRPAFGEDLPHSVSDYGQIGLISTPSARMAPDGEIDFGVSYINPYRRYFVMWQLLPAAQLTFRYSEVRLSNDFAATGGRLVTDEDFFRGIFGGSKTSSNLDRGFDLRIRLLKESRRIPEFSLGIQDFIGTGQFASEYLVATKRYYDFDFSLGVGWGYLAGRETLANPLGVLSDGFKRRAGFSALGGESNFDNLFRGADIGVFGGLEYFTPFKGLTFKLEYDSSSPLRQPLGVVLVDDSPFNVGLNYRPWDFIDLGLAWERGDATMFRVAFRGNMHSKGMPKFDPPPPPPKPRPPAWNTPPAPVSTSAPAASLASYPIQPSRSATQANQAGQHSASAAQVRLARAGYRIIDVEHASGGAIVTVTGGDPGVIAASESAAILALAAPAGGGVWLIGADPRYPNTQPVEIQQTQFAPASNVDAVFDALAGLGLTVEQMDLAGGRLIATLSAPHPISAGAAREAAMKIAENYGGDIKGVTVVAAGASLTWQRAEHRQNAPATRLSSDAIPGVSDRKTQIAAEIFQELSKANYRADAVHLADFEATIFISSFAFRQNNENVYRIGRIAANALPADIEDITIVAVNGGVSVDRLTIARTDLERHIKGAAGIAELAANTQISRAPADDPRRAAAIQNPEAYPSFNYYLRPKIRQHLGSTDGLIFADLNMSLSLQASLAPGLSVRGTAGKFVTGNLDELTVPGDSALPKVRTDIREYLQQGRDFIENLQADYIAHPVDGVYSRLSAGIFEWMYGGAGGELLYWPEQSPVAIGGTLNWVRQREFDQMFAFREYQTVEGYASIYYKLPFYNALAQFHVGRYLAKDKGATIDLQRRFNSGMTLGFFATYTNVSAAEFGEGSFDKGFYLSLPLDLLLTRSGRRNIIFGFRPLTRDGGQRAGVGPSLYGLVDGGSLTDFGKDWGNAPD